LAGRRAHDAAANSPIAWLRTDFRFEPGEGL
jgi:hypothetical protein